MAATEVNLEISAGFFRITTDTLVYNITVLDDQLPGVPRPVPKALAEPRSQTVALAAPEVAGGVIDFTDLTAGVTGGEDFYKQVSTDIFNDIGKLAKSLSTTMGDIPLEDRRLKRAELDEAGEKIENAETKHSLCGPYIAFWHLQPGSFVFSRCYVSHESMRNPSKIR